MGFDGLDYINIFERSGQSIGRWRFGDIARVRSVTVDVLDSRKIGPFRHIFTRKRDF